MVSSEAFRDVLRHFASGVTVVTADKDGERWGLTVSAFTSVSADPPLIAVVIDQRNEIHDILGFPEAPFAVNLLAGDQQGLSDRFAFSPRAERFLEGDWRQAENGAPVLGDGLAWLACEVEHRHPVGTHVLYVGRVRQARVPREEEHPLVYWNRSYRHLS